MPISLRDLHLSVTKRLKEQDIASPSLESRLLLCHAFDLSDEDFTLKAYDEFEKNIVEALVIRRLKGEPISKIIGLKEFWSLPFYTTTDTLDPRPDSEILIESVLKHIVDQQASLRILDMGTGTGCLLLSLLSELPNAKGVGLDISKKALDVAKINADRLGFGERTEFIEGDFSSIFEEVFDIVISNPPYIPSEEIDALQIEVKQFDPLLALDGGGDGLTPYRILSQSLQKNVKKKGFFALEFGLGQANDVKAIIAESPLSILEVNRDLENRDRCIIGQNHL